MNFLHCSNASRASKAEARREKLLTVARTLFVTHGFHATGVAQIATASGVGVGQIYRDFASKEDIVAALVEADLAAFLGEDELVAAVAQGDAAAVRAWVARFADGDDSIEECRMMTEIVAEGARNERIAEIHRQLDTRVRGTLTTALAMLAPAPAAAARRGQLVDLILTLGIGMVNRRILDPGLDCRALSQRLARLIDDELVAMRGM